MRALCLVVFVLSAGVAAQKTASLKVYNIISEPFLIEKDGKKSGFLVDLLNEVQKTAKDAYDFDIDFTWQKSATIYGMKNETTGAWVGMVGEVIADKDGIAVAPLTVTAKRMEVVDFLQPFTRSDLKVLTQITKPQSNVSCLTYAFQPMVWIGVIVAGVITLAVLACINWLTGPQGVICSIGSATWFLFSAGTLQGHEGATPRSCGGRILAVTWWIFSLWILAAYIGAVAGTYGTKNISQGLQSVEDIVQADSGITPYIIGGGSTEQYFKKSNVALVKALADRLKSVNSMPEGIKKVTENPNAVFIGENYLLAWETRGMADLQMLPANMRTAHYSFAMNQGANVEVVRVINKVLLDLQSSGRIFSLVKKWWQGTVGAGLGNGPRPTQQQVPGLSLYDIDAPLALLGGGIILALIVAAIQRCRNGRTEASGDKPENEALNGA